MGWIQIEAVCGSTKAKQTQAVDIFRGHVQMLPKICVKISIAAGTAYAKVRWKNTVVRAAGDQNLCKNMFRWVSNVNFSKAVMSCNQLANELGGLETHMKPKGLWLLEEKHCYRKTLCDILLSLQVQQISLLGEKSCHSNLQCTQVTSLGSTPHRKPNWQGYKVLLFK